MTYHREPQLAACIVHQAFCPINGRVDPADILRRMRVPVPDGTRAELMEEVGRRIMADPADVPEFVRELEKLDGIQEPMAGT